MLPKGIKQPRISILKVEDWKGKVLDEIYLKETKLSGKRVLKPEITFLTSHILHDNNARSPAFGERSLLNVKGHPEVSVKTGTTNDLRDNWTIGYTAHALVATWVGNNDNTSMSRAVSGVSGASPIWNNIMKEVLDKAEDGHYDKDAEGHAWPRQPDGIVGSEVCITTGVVPSSPESDPGCPTRFEYFLKDFLPQIIKGGFQDVHFDKNTGLFINEDTPPENIEVRQYNVIYDPLDTFICLDCQVLPSSQSATINYPLILPNDNSIEN